MSKAPFNHVLCWVDGSPEACRAAERAALLAKSFGAQLSFAVIGQILDRDEGLEAYAKIEGITGPIPPMVGGSTETCLQQAKQIADRAGVESVKSLTLSGDPVDALCEAASEAGADLVIIRHHRAGLVERLLHRSVSDALADRCGFAVLSDG